MNKSSVLISVIFLLSILTACASNVPTSTPTSDTDKIATIVAATLTAIPTDTPIPTVIPTVITPSEPLDRSNFQSVVRWVNFSISQNQPALIANVIGQDGVRFGKGDHPGYNNADFIVGELYKGLQNTSPQCLGYDPTHPQDYPAIFFSNINFDWAKLGYGESNYDKIFFVFMRSEQGWELVNINPIELQAWYGVEGQLQSCP